MLIIYIRLKCLKLQEKPTFIKKLCEIFLKILTKRVIGINKHQRIAIITRIEYYTDIQKNYGNRLKALCGKYEKRNKNKRDELYQQVLLSIFVSLESFKGKSSPYTFAYRVAINTCCNYVGREKHESKRSLDYDINISGYHFSYEAIIDYKIMIEFASTFKRVDREIIYMYLLGEKQEFIAEVLELTETNVSTKINRLKKAIETHMNKGMTNEK